MAQAEESSAMPDERLARCTDLVMRYMEARKANRQEELLTLLSRPPEGPECTLRVLANAVCAERNYVGEEAIRQYLQEEPVEPGAFVDGDPATNPGAPCVDSGLTKQEDGTTELTVKFDLNRWVGTSWIGCRVWLHVFATFLVCEASGKMLCITVGQQ